MGGKRPIQKISAMMLSVIMVVGMMPVSALAETSTFPIGTSGEIIAFDALGLDIAFQKVPLGTGKEDLELPDTLTATLRIAALEDEPLLDSGDADGGPVASPSDAEEAGGDIKEITVSLLVTWASSLEYDGEAAGTYVFMPELPEEFILTDGAELPAITVTVSEGEALVYAVRGTSISFSNGTEYPETVEGLGSEEDPLRIETAAQLAALAWSINHGSLPDSLPEYPYLILVNDLDLSDYDENEDEYGKGWVPIGGYYGGCYNEEDDDIETYAFSGTFDGNHKTIRNLYVERGERYVGLFGYVKEGTVKNLTVENGDVEGYAATGGIVGVLYKGQIENCVFSGSVTGEEYTGGIVGDLGDSKVEDCKNIGSITGKRGTGGIVGGAGGDSENDYLRNCINAGPVTGAVSFTGGITGLLVGMTADYCVNTGAVQGGTDLNTGGVAGTISEGIIQNCVNGGPVSGSANNIGGLAGLVRTSTIRNCVNYADVSGTANSVGGVAGFAQEGSAVTNCLTTGNIRGEVNILERGGVSGVVGWLQNGSGDANTITGCVALGQIVIKDGDMGNVARITAMDDIWDNTVSDNFAWSGMQLFWDGELIPEEDHHWLQDGENADVATLYPLWTTGALAESWSDAGVWTLAEGKLPVLTGLPHQNDEFPSHISGIAGVIVSPDSVSVQKGTTKSFTAAIAGIGAIDDTVTWSVSGAAHAGTTIDSTGMLTVAADETASAVIITATANGDDSKKGTADVTVTDSPTIPDTTYIVTLNGVGLGAIGAGSYAQGATVTIDAGSRSNYSFTGWTASGVSLASPGSASTTFTMPANNVTVTAGWSDIGGSGGSGGGGGSSSDSGSSVTVTPPAADKPNSPTQVETTVSGTVDSKGNVTVNITDKAVTDAFDKALAEAKKNGTEQNGITVVLRVDTSSKTGSHVTVNLPKTVQDTIIAKEIVSVIIVVDNPDIRIGMDLATVQEINKQAKSDVNITAARMDSGKLTGDAKNTIGSRPVFDLKVNYGNGKAVSSFGAGSVSVSIPYTLGANEKAGNVQAVYVDAKGKVHWLINSVYDSVEQVLRFATSHFSTYGIGYKQTNTAFTDIAAHWAKEDIEFVVSRGLFSGTSNTTFSPNTAMTRGMFVTALGRLASADVSGDAKSSFTDVKSDAYYMGYIEWASKNGIVNGVGNNRFAPDQSITREQMAVIMQNYAKVIGFTLPKVHAENTFADSAKISAYAKDAVKQMQMAGVISGKNGNLFDPQGTATRAEVSAVLRRFVELAISSDTMQGWTRNDSGQWMYYENGKPLTGKKDIGGATYTFDKYGVTADVPKNLRYATYTVQKGDSFWLIARKLGCTMAELERLNNKSRFSLIHPGDVLRVPEK